MKTELLAPAKNIKIAKSAIDCGADAVYIGSVSFGARKNASNSIEEIEELVKYAHKFYVKVYVTVNTIVSDDELDEVRQLICKLHKIGVDALIIQDMAIIKMAIDNKIPKIPLHISTQCDNRLNDKVKFFSKMGIPRVVLARELSIEQIKDIIKDNPNIEIESFVHGALCVSYSGQCYLSAYIGGRSANKGECAQPCRKMYSLSDEQGNILVKDKHLLCLKDFNASKYLYDLVDAGVKSFKIEGRLKEEGYVRNVVAYYRKLLDKYSEKTSSGSIYLDFEPNLYKTFNRGYTEYFLKERTNCFNFDSPKFIGEKIGKVVAIEKKYFILNLNKGVKLSNQDGLCFDKKGEKGCLVNNIIENKVFPNKFPNIKVGDFVYRNFDSDFEKQVLSPNTVRKIKIVIIYDNYKLTAIDEDQNEVTLNVNERESATNKEKMLDSLKKGLCKTGDTDFIVENCRIDSVPPFIPVSQINKYRRELLSSLSLERIKNYKMDTQKSLRYNNYYTDELDFRANVHNKDAVEFYKNSNAIIKECSFESNRPKRQVELMRTKHCIKYALNICKSKDKLFLIDDKNIKYPLKFDCKNCEMCVLSPD